MAGELEADWKNKADSAGPERMDIDSDSDNLLW